MSNPLSTIEILRTEAEQIHGDQFNQHIDDSALSLELNRLGSTALCLSGGGIRSATFALGVIQALAGRPRPCRQESAPPSPEQALLGQFNYLSTVSGGGYIGSWLSAWLSRQPYGKVIGQLTGRSPAIGAVEPTPIGDLRRDSNYLTPKIGLASADTWAAAAMVLRNLILNWTVLIPLFLLSLIAVKLGAIAVAWLPFAAGPQSYLWPLAILSLLSLGSLLISLRFSLLSQRLSGAVSRSQTQFFWGGLVPLVGAGILWTGALDTVIGYELLIVTPLPDLMILGALAGVVVYGLAQIITLLTTGELLSRLLHLSSWKKLKHRGVWGWLAAGAIYGALLGLGAHLLGGSGDQPLRLLLVLLFAPPWFLASQFLAESGYVAFTSAIPRSDEQREWFARSGGWSIAVALAWIAGVALALFGSWAAEQAEKGFDLTFNWLFAGGGLSAVIGWLTGGSGRTTAQGGPNISLSGKVYSIAASLAAPLFFAFLLIIGSMLIDLVVLRANLFAYLLAYSDYPMFYDDMGVIIFNTIVDRTERWLAAPSLIGAGVVLAIIAAVASRYVNVNRFSLHGLYRNRLVRAFLGASHLGRQPDRFTGFDMDDNLPMSALWPDKRDQRTGEHWRPFHILNLTLNVVSTRNLAWQQRKAMSFTVSPLHSGAASLGDIPTQAGGILARYRGAFRPSNRYGGGQRRGQKSKTSGITLGTAMAISGAAVNPNMGYHSSPTVSLLLTLLNVRLGWWLGNPGPDGDKTWERNGPKVAAEPLLQDAFGLTTANQPYVSLSDGGHFENLGLYEMVRRRCRYVVLSDAGADPEYQFEDLGNALRKIAIDFGIPIRFHDLQKLQPRPADPNSQLTNVPYHAVALIDYAAVDGPGAEPGILLYLKPSFHNDQESAGVKAYAKTHASFPHESTLDQWFSESQFESYRSLGFEIMDSILAEVQGCSTELIDLKTALKRLAAPALQQRCEECDPPSLPGA